MVVEANPDHLAIYDHLAEMYPDRQFSEAEIDRIADWAWIKMWEDFPWWGIYMVKSNTWRLPAMFFAGDWVARYVTTAVTAFDARRP